MHPSVGALVRLFQTKNNFCVGPIMLYAMEGLPETNAMVPTTRIGLKIYAYHCIPPHTTQEKLNCSTSCASAYDFAEFEQEVGFVVLL